MNPQGLRRNGGRLRRLEAVTVLSLLNASFAWIGCAGEGTAPNPADRSTRNHAPRPEGQIPEVTQWVFGGPVDVAVSPYFSDPDGDSLEYEASWSDGRAVSLAQGFATVTPVAGGTATIRVTATDPAGLSALQIFDVRSVITTPPLRNPNLPRPTTSIPSTQLRIGGTTTIHLADHFYLPWGTTFEVTSSSSTVSTSVSNDTLTLEGRSLGPALVTLQAFVVRHHGWGEQAFHVAVVPASAPPNQWPVLSRCMNQKIVPWQVAVSEDVSAYFADRDGDELTYVARSEAYGAVAASMSGSILTLEGKSGRGAFIEVTATDPGGLFARAEFFVRRPGTEWASRWCRPEDATGTAAASSPAADLDGGKGGVTR